MQQLHGRHERPERTEYLTAAQVAQWLGVSKKWIYRLSREGRIPTIRVGRCIRFRPDAIEAWMVALEGRVAPR